MDNNNTIIQCDDVLHKISDAIGYDTITEWNTSWFYDQEVRFERHGTIRLPWLLGQWRFETAEVSKKGNKTLPRWDPDDSHLRVGWWLAYTGREKLAGWTVPVLFRDASFETCCSLSLRDFVDFFSTFWHPTDIIRSLSLFRVFSFSLTLFRTVCLFLFISFSLALSFSLSVFFSSSLSLFLCSFFFFFSPFVFLQISRTHLDTNVIVVAPMNYGLTSAPNFGRYWKLQATFECAKSGISRQYELHDPQLKINLNVFTKDIRTSIIKLRFRSFMSFEDLINMDPLVQYVLSFLDRAVDLSDLHFR